MKLNDILNKDDRALLEVCVRVLGDQFGEVKKDALQKAADAARDAPDIRKVNLAMRAINSAFIEALKARGVTNWRQYLDNQNK